MNSQTKVVALIHDNHGISIQSNFKYCTNTRLLTFEEYICGTCTLRRNYDGNHLAIALLLKG